MASGSQCPTKYYSDTKTQFSGLTNNGNLCRPCDATCATCDNAGGDSCISCQSAFVMSGNAIVQCLTSCPVGNSSNCQYCHSQCNGCSGPSNTDCISCLQSSTTNSQGLTVCVPTCGSNEYQLEINGDYFCLPCHSQCIGCTGPANDQCKHCKNVNNTYSAVNECTATCPYGSYTDDQNKCQPCHPQCSGCTGPSRFNCSLCLEDSVRQTTGELVCVPTCPLWQVYDLSSSNCVLTT